MKNELQNEATFDYVQNNDLRQVNLSSEEDEIDLVSLFYALKGHLLQIILVMVLFGVAGFFGTRAFIKPKYESTAKIYVISASNNSVIDLSDLQIGSQLTSDYLQLMKSRPLLEDVITNLDLDMTYKELAELFTIENASDTRILSITATTENAQLSSDIANELVNQAMKYLPNVMETEEPNLVEAAIPAEQKCSPSYTKNTLMASLIGGLLVCAVVIVRFLMDDTLVTPDDVEKYLGTEPLASIPESHTKKKKNGKKR